MSRQQVQMQSLYFLIVKSPDFFLETYFPGFLSARHYEYKRFKELKFSVSFFTLGGSTAPNHRSMTLKLFNESLHVCPHKQVFPLSVESMVIN